MLGALSFNGQRCTAIKITFVHESIAEKVVNEVSRRIDDLKVGLPWEKGVRNVFHPISPHIHFFWTSDLSLTLFDVCGSRSRSRLCAINKSQSTSRRSLRTPSQKVHELSTKTETNSTVRSVRPLFSTHVTFRCGCHKRNNSVRLSQSFRTHLLRNWRVIS